MQTMLLTITITIQTSALPMPPAPDGAAFVKKIGRTAYEVSFHFTSTQNVSDKIKRPMKRDMSA